MWMTHMQLCRTYISDLSAKGVERRARYKYNNKAENIFRVWKSAKQLFRDKESAMNTVIGHLEKK